ncbi:hypothetical protein GTP69_00265 [Duganella sp. CY42W]|uniref:Uncharacterized protein n=1 Tax=Duganella levis TaxID=2692169 RepID=A0ABW9VT88_9BURK|nr:hypothetical protein [Duganella levis]
MIAPDGQSLWPGVEAPQHRDGPLAAPEQGAVCRSARFDREGAMGASDRALVRRSGDAALRRQW